MNNFFLEISGLSKSYGKVQALAEVSLRLIAGEVHALMGENGAGKSTFIKCLSGAVCPDAGRILVDGSPLSPGNLHEAEKAGIVALHQESSAFPHLDAVDNLFVGRELRRFGIFQNRPQMRQETEKLLNRLGEKIDLRTPLEELSLAQRQMIGIARALSHKSRLLILDEPTASLSERETQTLFRIIRQLQSEGIAILYVSHRMEEVFALSSQVTVLRDGRLVETRPTSELTRDELTRLMIGRELLQEAQRKTQRAPGEIRLEVNGLTQKGRFRDISFTLHAGEIVGLAGLVGAGRSEVATAIFGIERATSGTVKVNGVALPSGSVHAAIKCGMAFVPEDRQRQGLVLPLSVADNLNLTKVGAMSRGKFRSAKKERGFAEKAMQKLNIKTASSRSPVKTLSGGNQQKVSLGKWLSTSPSILLLDEPTRGVDVGAKAEIYRTLRQFAQEGMATLVISSDLPELLLLCDRILVMCEGKIAGELSRERATEETILALALPSHKENHREKDTAELTGVSD